MMDIACWEDLCQRCGRCCYEKIEYAGRVYYTNTPCDKLDQETSLCTVYDNRLEEKAECIPLTFESLQHGILPEDCPYVSEIPDYNAPQLWDDEDE